MTPNDFVFNQIYKGAISAGASEKAAKDCAIAGLDSYKKNRMRGKVANLIADQIKQAKSISKAKGGKR